MLTETEQIRLYILIGIILLWVTGYLFWAQKKIKNKDMPLIAQEERPDIDQESFLYGLEKGKIKNPLFASLVKSLGDVVYGDKKTTYALLIALLSRGHMLIQGTPGTGKTTLVRVFAQLCELAYQRVQCTPDLLPQDVIGAEVFHDTEKKFTVQYGPIVTNLLHLDEINRATPKLQSAFLEAMQEKSVTVGTEKKDLPEPYFVVATQNPYDVIGTYMLPYAQIDRFMVSSYVSGLDKQEEIALLQTQDHQSLDVKTKDVTAVLTEKDILIAQNNVDKIQTPEDVIQYAVSCIYILKKYAVGLSTRASKSLLLAAKAWAYLQDKNSVEKKDIDAVLEIVLKHRLEYLLSKEISSESLYRLTAGVARKDDIVG